VSPAFADLKQQIQAAGIRKPNSILELSDSIHDKEFVEYPVHLKRGPLKSFTCALSSEGIHAGEIGVELVSATGEIVHQSARDLTELNLQSPVSFDLKGVEVREEGTWLLRLFAQTPLPLYVFEFASYSFLGYSRRATAPFGKIDYLEEIEILSPTSSWQRPR
jgi:hypothetical protein